VGGGGGEGGGELRGRGQGGGGGGGYGGKTDERSRLYGKDRIKGPAKSMRVTKRKGVQGGAGGRGGGNHGVNSNKIGGEGQ